MDPTATPIDRIIKDAQCVICEHCSYICEYCRKPCCTACSKYDPDCEEDTDFPKGRNGGIRNHPKCILDAKKQEHTGEKSKAKQRIWNKRAISVIQSPSPIKKKKQIQ